MKFSNIFMISLVASAALAVGCGGPVEESEEEPIVIITSDDSGTNNGTTQTDDTDPDPDTDPDANNGTDPDANNGTDPGTNNETNTNSATNNQTTDTEEPCGNGVIDDGETCDADCPTTCDDFDPCTIDTMTGDPDACTSVCEYEHDSACDAYDGTYSGTYYIQAQEKVGSTVVNSVTCEGTYDANIDATRDNPFEGTAECSYGGSLGGFDSNQSATLTGTLSPDGSVELRVTHDFGTDRDGNFSVDGTIENGALSVDDTGSFKPHPMSAVPWETTIRLGAE